MAEEDTIPTASDYSSSSSYSPLPDRLAETMMRREENEQLARYYNNRPRNSLGTESEGEEDCSPPPLIKIKREFSDDGEQNEAKLNGFKHREGSPGKHREETRDPHDTPIDFSIKKTDSPPMNGHSGRDSLSPRFRDSTDEGILRESTVSIMGHLKAHSDRADGAYKPGPTVFPSQDSRDPPRPSPASFSPTSDHSINPKMAALAGASLPPGLSPQALLQAGLLPPGVLNSLPLLQTAPQMSPEKASKPDLMKNFAKEAVHGVGMMHPGLSPGAPGLLRTPLPGLPNHQNPLAGIEVAATQAALNASSHELFSQYRQYMLQLVEQNRYQRGSNNKTGPSKQRKYSGESASPSASSPELPTNAQAPNYLAARITEPNSLPQSPKRPSSDSQPEVAADFMAVPNSAPVMPPTNSLLTTSTTRKRPRPTPDNRKDMSYWERRRKNNEAAKRSRDARRAKEDEIAIRAAFLEQENLKLRLEVAALKTETGKLRCMLYNS